MKIISTYKDYYDYLAYIYGIDNSIIFNRRPFKILKQGTIFESIKSATKSVLRHYSFTPYPYTKNDGLYKFKWLIICGRHFLLVSEKKQDSKFTEYTPYKLLSLVQYEFFLSKWDGYRKLKPYDYFVGDNHVDSMCIEISKLIKNPIFELSDDINLFGKDISTDRNYYEFKSSRLDDYDIARVYPPQKLYQDISYFLGNTLNDTPDIKPPVEVSNKDKITGHGFDLITSFRGKNQ